MMKKITFLIIILLFPLPVFSQKTAPLPTPKALTEKEQKLRAQKLQAVSMVEKTAEEAVFWDDKRAAVEAMTDAADLLWDENPTQSAKWLNKAWTMTGEIVEPAKDAKANQFRTVSDKTNLQAQVLQIAQKRDAKLAEKFLKQLADRETGEKKDKGAFDDKSARSEQLLYLAQQTIETNPNAALNLAERSLADGISYSLQNVLTDLRKKDVNLANRLFDAALARFAGGGVPDASEALILAGYLFKPGFTMAMNTSGQMIMAVNPLQQKLPPVANSEPDRARNFLNAAYRLFFARPVSLDTPENKKRASDTLLLADFVVNYYDKHAPELAQPTRIFATQLRNQVSPNSQNRTSESGSTNVSRLPKNATKEELYEAMLADLEEKADKETDPAAKNLAYIRAAISTKPESYERGKRTAEKITDEKLQADVIAFLFYRAALYFLEKKEIETAEELAPQIKEPLRRSIARINIARTLLQPKADKKAEQTQIDLEKQKAFDLLGDVERDLKRENATNNSVKIMLGAIATLVELDKAQGLTSLEEAIQKINQLETFNLKETSAPRLGYDFSGKSDAWTVGSPRVGFGFRNAIEPLLETDFEQVASIVERFGARETRGVGRIEVAKLFFQKNKDLLNQK